jgi:hypothetical protein
MACPHSLIGTASMCSQCKGAVPQRVVHDKATGRMVVDGVAQERTFTPPPSSADAQRRGGRRRGRVRRVRDIAPRSMYPFREDDE